MIAGWLFLLSASLFTLLDEASGAASIMAVKLGGTAVIEFPKEVETIECESHDHGKHEIVKDGKLTHVAHEHYGDRIKWHDHKLEIEHVKKTDLNSFHYRQSGMPMVISLQEEEH